MNWFLDTKGDKPAKNSAWTDLSGSHFFLKKLNIAVDHAIDQTLTSNS